MDPAAKLERQVAAWIQILWKNPEAVARILDATRVDGWDDTMARVERELGVVVLPLTRSFDDDLSCTYRIEFSVKVNEHDLTRGLADWRRLERFFGYRLADPGERIAAFVRISCVSPYWSWMWMKYDRLADGTEHYDSQVEYTTDEHSGYKNRIDSLLESYGYCQLPRSILRRRVAGVHLTGVEPERATVENCLFFDWDPGWDEVIDPPLVVFDGAG